MSRRLALLVATYEHEDAGLSRLTAPAHDAEALAEVLRDPAIAGFDVTMLVNEPHYRVGEAMGDLFSGRRSDDLVLLYFTGHGLKDEDGRLYLATRNTRRDSLLFSSLPAEQIDQALTDCSSRRKVLILDCCYSGAFPAGRLAKSDTEVHALDRFQGGGRTVLTASDAAQYSYEGDRFSGSAVQSVFTRHLVNGLRDGSADLDGDGDITLDELYRYVHDRVVEEMPQQRPKRRDDVEGRIVIARNVHWTLPVYLSNALQSPIAAERMAALDGLAHLRRTGNDIVRDRANEVIRELAHDDSRAVSSAAAALLQNPSRPLGPVVRDEARPPVEEVAPQPTADAGPTVPSGRETPQPVSERGAHTPPASEERPPRPQKRDPARRLRRMTSARTAAAAAVTRWWGQARAHGTHALPGGLALLASVLMVIGILRTDSAYAPFERGPLHGLVWYVAGMAAVALAAGGWQLVPRTRGRTGPSPLFGAAAAAVWGSVYFAEHMTALDQQDLTAYRYELAGHAALLLAAVLAGFPRGATFRLQPRRPKGPVGWTAAAVGVGAVVLLALALCSQLDHAARLYQGPVGMAESDYRAHAYMAAMVVAAVVPVWAALLTPAGSALALLLAWAAGDMSVALGTGTYMWLRLDDSTESAWTAAGALLAVAATAAVLHRWGRSDPVVRLRRTTLIVGVWVLPLLAAGGAVAVYRAAGAVHAMAMPLGLALSPRGDRLYVTGAVGRSDQPYADTDSLAGFVAVVDTKSHRTLATPVRGGEASWLIAVDWSGRYAYYASGTPGSVTVLSTWENKTIGDPVPVGKDLRKIMVSSRGQVWGVDGYSDQLVEIGTQSNGEEGDRVGLGSDWNAVALNPTGDVVYVSNGRSGTLSRIDTSTGKRLGGSVTLGYTPDGLAVGGDDRLYVLRDPTGRSGTTLTAFDADTLRQAGAPLTLPSGVHLGTSMTVSPNGRRLYLSDILHRTLSVVDTDSMKLIGSPVDVGLSATAVVVSRDNRHVYAAGLMQAEVATFDADDPDDVSRFPIKVP